LDESYDPVIEEAARWAGILTDKNPDFYKALADDEIIALIRQYHIISAFTQQVALLLCVVAMQKGATIGEIRRRLNKVLEDETADWSKLCRITDIQSLPLQATKYIELLAGYDYRPWVTVPVAYAVSKLINDFAMYSAAMKPRWGDLFDNAYKKSFSSKQLVKMIKLLATLTGKSEIVKPKIKDAISKVIPEIEEFLNNITKIGESLDGAGTDRRATES